MAKNRKSKKKKNNLKIIFTLLAFVLILFFSYTIFNKFIVPVWERYKEKPVVTKEVPYKEEEIKEVPTLNDVVIGKGAFARIICLATFGNCQLILFYI